MGASAWEMLALLPRSEGMRLAQPQQSEIRNRLLASLSSEDFALIQPHLEEVVLEMRTHLFRAGQTITHVTFPESGIASIVADTEEARFEIGLVGWEGLAGASLVLGVDQTPHTCLIQAPGNALHLEAGKLQAAMDASSSPRVLLLRFIHTFIVQVSQTAYANAGYSIEERLARWLLMSHDRIGGDDLPITHDFLSIMLGTRRPGVTLAVQMLEGLGVIKATRGLITVRDREELEQLAGQSYGFAEQIYASIFQVSIRGSRQ